MKEVLFEIPAGTTPSACRGCGADVYWIITKTGKRMPVNGDGTSHFSSCPMAGAFRRKRDTP